VKKPVLGLAIVATLICSAPALAASVNLRVEGKTDELVPSTRVTLPSQPVLKDGTHPCGATSIGAALQGAVGDDWAASYDSGFATYLLTGVRGYSPASPDYFALWVNHKYTSLSVCDDGLQEGDDVLILVDYCDYDAQAQTCTNDPVLPLALDAPKVVTPGVPFTVTVTRYDGTGAQAPVAGASVGGATTDSAGHATVTVPGAGPSSLRATKPNFAGVTQAICATTGSDGLCGSSRPYPGGGGGGSPSPACATNGHDGLCGTVDHTPALARITSIREQQTFAKGNGPRTLAGTVAADPAGLRSVQLRLTRRDGARCSRYDDEREQFRRTRHCRATAGKWFDAGDRNAWSYLLPSKLGRGRYVLDVRTFDGAGNVDNTLQRGRNRIVFRVS
jgi:hypothetical protein